MSTRPNRQDGFLLLEMLVALAVVAVMGALMSSFLGQLGAVNRLESEIAKQTELNAAAAYLQRVLEGARPAPILDAKPDTNPHFEGKQTSMRFATVTRRGFYSLALRDVRVFTSSTAGRTSLEHTIGARRMEGGKPVPHGRPIPILDSIESIGFQYSDGSSWGGTWSVDDMLPRAVKIRISTKTGNRTISSEAIAQLY